MDEKRGVLQGAVCDDDDRDTVALWVEENVGGPTEPSTLLDGHDLPLEDPLDLARHPYPRSSSPHRFLLLYHRLIAAKRG
jgi:hypothetical protein